MQDLRGLHAVVTGASSGLGEEFARQLAARGLRLTLTARTRSKLETLASELSARHGVDVAVVVADLGSSGGPEGLCRDVDALGTAVDVLINNAGFGSAGPLVSADGERQAAMVRLNCESVVTLTHHFLPGMVERRRGGVVQVASTAGHQPMPFMATYGASKAFVLSFSTALSEELRGSGVTVTALCPGPVPTGFQQVAGITPGMERVAALSPKDTVRRALEGFCSGHDVVVPGTINRVQTTVSKLAPRRAVTAFLAGAMKRMGRH